MSSKAKIFFSPPNSSSTTTNNSSSSSSTCLLAPIKPSLLSRGEEGSLSEYIKSHSTNMIEEFMFLVTSSRIGLAIVILMSFGLALLYGFVTMSWEKNLINIVVIVGQILLSKNGVRSVFVKDEVVKVENGDKLRLAGLLVLLTTRFFLFDKNKILFVPTMLIYHFGGNKVFLQSTLCGLLPTFYLCSLYCGTACWQGYSYYLENGMDQECVSILAEGCGLAFCLWVTTFYLVTATGYLTMKVKTLENTRNKLEDALSVRNTFMSHISHEFRCPIQSSMGCLQLLKETEMNRKQHELVDTIILSNSISLLLIEDILRLVKIEHGKDNEESKHVFNLGKALNVLDKMVSGYAKQFNVTLKFTCEGVKDLIIKSSQSQLLQILSNLITNGIKASKENDLVEIVANVIENNEQYNKTTVQFNIIDHGKGIPENLIPTIFEPFVQLGNVNESKVPSSGLGLTTVSHLVNLMNGEINVKSTLGVGSEFIVELPFELAPPEAQEEIDQDPILELQLAVPQEQLKAGSSACIEDDISGNSIIVAEDNAVNRKVIVKMLSSLGHKADAVCNGEELLEQFDPSRHKIVITDMNMPNMNGIDAAKELRNRHGKDFKIYLLTGNVMANEDDYSTVIDKVVIKPISKPSLKQLIT